MSSFIPPDPTPPDRTLKEAEQAAQRDFARLAHLHDIAWSIDIFQGTVRFCCACSGKPFNAAQLDKHLLDEVRSARVPKRK